jgi:hypothetical protein
MRMEGLAKILAKEIAFDAVMEVVSDPSVFERMKDIYEIQDIELLGNELEVIGKQIDRNPNLKFSKSSAPKTITKFSISELVSNDLFREKFINSSEDIQKQLNEIRENSRFRKNSFSKLFSWEKK